MKRLNNKGYMLVEIILAFAIAMVIMYFVTELTIKVKNKNDDLLVRTLTSTDQAIIYNMIMREVYAGNAFDCSRVVISGNNKLTYKGQTYGEKSVIVNEYVDDFNKDLCTSKNTIQMKVNALPDYNFDVVIP